jgi:hypothetical protein
MRTCPSTDPFTSIIHKERLVDRHIKVLVLLFRLLFVGKLLKSVSIAGIALEEFVETVGCINDHIHCLFRLILDNNNVFSVVVVALWWRGGCFFVKGELRRRHGGAERIFMRITRKQRVKRPGTAKFVASPNQRACFSRVQCRRVYSSECTVRRRTD